jgi:hypothetical protein
MAEDEAREIVSRAVTDPTSLTTAALNRAIADLKEWVKIQVNAVIDRFDTRITAIDKATDKFEAGLVRVPTDVQLAVSQLDRLTTEKFTGVSDQLTELRASIEKSERVTAVAVNAALEAVGKGNAAQAESFLASSNKTEANFTKAIDQMALLIQTTNSAQSDKIDDVKERLTRLEAALLGKKEQTHDQLSVIAAVVAVLGLLITLGLRLFGK